MIGQGGLVAIDLLKVFYFKKTFPEVHAEYLFAILLAAYLADRISAGFSNPFALF